MSSVNADSDTVTAEASTKVPGFFAKAFGISDVDVGARATARIGSYTGWALNPAPWTLTMNDLQWGTDLDLKVVPGDQYAPGNFGAINLVVPGPRRGEQNWRWPGLTVGCSVLRTAG